MKHVRLLMALLAAVFACQAVASADAYADMKKVQKAFYGVHSFRAVLTTDRGTQIKMEFVAPDKWHELLPGGMEAIISGSTMRMKTPAGWMSLPMPGAMTANLQSIRNWAADKDLKADYKITDLGMDGALHKYEYVGEGADSTMWVRPDHLPDHTVVKAKGNTVTIRYSDYNAPISIPG